MTAFGFAAVDGHASRGVTDREVLGDQRLLEDDRRIGTAGLAECAWGPRSERCCARDSGRAAQEPPSIHAEFIRVHGILSSLPAVVHWQVRAGDGGRVAHGRPGPCSDLHLLVRTP